MKVLGSGEKEARGMKILTEYGEQAMGTLWANQELEELFWIDGGLYFDTALRNARV
jgi:hypothetical protein